MAGSTSGWKFQIALALSIRCSRNCASFALACWTMCVSRSYRSTTSQRHFPNRQSKENAHPRHPQTGHTWYKFALSGLFTAISL